MLACLPVEAASWTTHVHPHSVHVAPHGSSALIDPCHHPVQILERQNILCLAKNRSTGWISIAHHAHEIIPGRCRGASAAISTYMFPRTWPSAIRVTF